MKSRLPNLGQCIATFILFLGTVQTAWAGDYRILGGMGYGGTGIVQTQSTSSSSSTTTPSTSTGTIKRSEGPGVFTLGVEKITGERYTLALDYTRGFRLGPFSSGVTFAGVSVRRYFSPVPWGSAETKGQTTVFVKRLNWYVGLGAGVATGTIIREGDVVPSVTASGVYVGFRGGADIPLNPHGFGIRPELMMSGTFSAALPNPSTLSLFSLGCQVYFQL